jgi:putative ABC transport system permease protein
MTTLWQDITYGIRMLIKKPGFTVAAVLSLALGIGANTTIFSIINATLLSSMPFKDPSSLMIVWSNRTNEPDARGNATAIQFRTWKDTSKSFDAVGAYYGLSANLGGEQDGSYAESIEIGQLSYSMWDTLGVKPLIGRVFTKDEDQDGNAAKVAVLSYPFWQRRFAGSASALGQTFNADNERITVIGVMPEGFDFFNNRTAYFAPIGFSPQQLSSAATFLIVAGRLKDGVNIQQAQAELDGISAGLRERDPERHRERGAFVEDLQRAFTQDLEEPLLVLQSAVVFVLLIACSNVAGLLLARAAVRRSEVSVRAAMGATRSRVVRQLLTESVLLALAGGILGFGLGWAGLRMVLAALPEGALPSDNIGISLTVLAFTAAVSIVTGLVFGVIPAFQTSKVDLATALKEFGRSGSEGAARQRIRQVLVTAQIALALVLLIGAGLMMNTFLKVRSNELGADTSNLLTFEFRHTQSELMKPVGRFRNVGLWEINPATNLNNDRMLQRLQSIPGVVSVAASNRPPLTGTMWMNFNIQGRPAPAPTEDGNGQNAAYFAITPNYFATMKTQVMQGRDFTTQDSASAPPAIIINKAMADRWWPGENPIGKYVTLDFVPNEVPREIVGVTANASMQGRFQREAQPAMYVPHVQQTTNWLGPAWGMRAAMFFVMRTTGDPSSITSAVRDAVAEIDRNKPAGNLRTVEGYLDDGLGETRVFMLLLAVFGISAGVLAAIGIYGVMAFAVTQRTREIGIRVALGGTSGNVVGLVLRQAVVVISIGIVLGLAGAFALTRFLTSFLWQVSPTDPVTFIAVSVGLLLIAVVACLIPTRRAITVDPTVALRYE